MDTFYTQSQLVLAVVSGITLGAIAGIFLAGPILYWFFPVAGALVGALLWLVWMWRQSHSKSH